MSRKNARKHQTPPQDYATEGNIVENSLQAIERELTALSKHKALSMYNSVFKQLFLQLLRGIFFGLGTALGATIVLSGLLFLLAQIEFVPIIGEYVHEIIVELNGDTVNIKDVE